MVQTKKPERESFAAVLASIRPKTDIELAENLAKLIEEVRATGKKGTLSVTFEVKPVDGGGGAVIVNDKIGLKLPERNRDGSMAYIGEGNKLQRTDPSAMPLFDEDIRDVDFSTGEVKKVQND
ncbi:MAG: hypothetical protein WBA28_05015 [Microbacteriaceae bacterium]